MCATLTVTVPKHQSDLACYYVPLGMLGRTLFTNKTIPVLNGLSEYMKSLKTCEEDRPTCI